MKTGEFSIPIKQDGENPHHLLCRFYKTEKKIKVGKLTHWTVQLIEDANIVK